ncbi:MAG: NlpC/P60 family protein [Acidobacteria bacterium]|nr:MAG: NlpC/P60 family protein [Acidobacteriota bacterium]REK01813.1 MAG: NlpC/P60 family protein [Acidobacteriota bacterium]REK14769.1 MAG: NlpC/P60 family protein [Acidobacteriota bacterium]REK45484.1 MAG: NlpC/P60 family protein [Acidobacteriota bacterium]
MNFSERFGKLRILLAVPFLFLFVFSTTASAQDRERVVEETNQPEAAQQNTPARKRPGMTNEIRVVREPAKPLVKKTGSSSMTTSSKAAGAAYYNATVRSMMLNSIREKIGKRYVYGSQGPNTYDCSGFVWKVFEDAGLPFTRTSAAQYWRTFEPVEGDDRYQFGTLVFFNRLGHVGIVVNKDGFYHASTSKGVTYSKFEGYWEKRIVGYRRVPFSALVFEGPEF